MEALHYNQEGMNSGVNGCTLGVQSCELYVRKGPLLWSTSTVSIAEAAQTGQNVSTFGFNAVSDR